MLDVDGLLIDLDGTVYQGSAPIPGAVDAIRRLDEAGIPVLFTTNTSRKPRRAVVEGLAALGIHIEPDRVLTAPVAAARWLASEGLRRILPLLPEATHEDLAALEMVGAEGSPDAVVVGDLGSGFTFERLNGAFLALRDGARLIAVHRNRWWLPDGGPTLDAGPFVVALEYATRVDAVLVGKPAPAFFETAAELLGVARGRLAVVGDDPESDVRGARAAGITAVQVETGKFDPALARSATSEERPDRRIASIADLPDLVIRGDDAGH